jgi:hypothetical protein
LSLSEKAIREYTMRKKLFLFILIQIISFFSFGTALQAWSGDIWGPESGEEIERIATEMINFDWTPKSEITNFVSTDKFAQICAGDCTGE